MDVEYALSQLYDLVNYIYGQTEDQKDSYDEYREYLKTIEKELDKPRAECYVANCINIGLIHCNRKQIKIVEKDGKAICGEYINRHKSDVQ